MIDEVWLFSRLLSCIIFNLLSSLQVLVFSERSHISSPFYCFFLSESLNISGRGPSDSSSLHLKPPFFECYTVAWVMWLKRAIMISLWIWSLTLLALLLVCSYFMFHQNLKFCLWISEGINLFYLHILPPTDRTDQLIPSLYCSYQLQRVLSLQVSCAFAYVSLVKTHSAL